MLQAKTQYMYVVDFFPKRNNSSHLISTYSGSNENRYRKPAVNAQIFVNTIFRGLNFHGDKFLWVGVAHENLTPLKNYLLVHEIEWHEEDVEYQKALCVRGYHIHKHIWNATMNERLACMNSYSQFLVRPGCISFLSIFFLSH